MSVERMLPRSIDAALCGFVLVIGLVETWLPLESRAGDGSRAADTLVVVLVAAALWWRRSRPLAAALAVMVLLAGSWELLPIHVMFFGQFVPLAAAVFSVARHGRGREPQLGALAGAATLLFVDLRIEELQDPGEIVFHWGVLTVVWCFGWGLRRSQQHAEESTRRAVEVEVEAAQRTLLAVAEERTRIARELHDIVAHAVSTMVVQAGAAEQVVDDDPAYTRTALRTIRTTGNGAMAEMRRLVTMLREADDEAALTPQPGVDGIADLVEAARAAGLDADLEVEGQRIALPAGLDLTAYRVVQEALTNVRRHAGACRVVVRLGYGAEDLSIEVADDGEGGSVSSAGSGHGLIGMRERAALYGGRVDAGPLPGRGFRVAVRLPVAAR